MLIHVLTAVTLAASGAGGVIHVDVANCPGPGDGSEQDPYCSIQDAIAAAADTDEIVVAPGTYLEVVSFLGKAITLRSSGGPAVTTIDGQQIGSVVSCVSGEGPDTVLQGFTITGGTGTNPNTLPAALATPGEATIGGGMLNDQSSPTVIDCVFFGNTAWFGGGMMNRNGAAQIDGCTFDLNGTVYDGAGIFNVGSTITVSDSTFIRNFALNSGGGAYNFNCVSTYSNCVFSVNMAQHRGAGGYNIFSTDTFTDCTFYGNGSQHDGGGMYIVSGSETTAIDCTFEENSADNGGGIYSNGGDVTLTGCTFLFNVVPGGGGGLNVTNGTALLSGCDFSYNVGQFGAGAEIASPATLVTDCSFNFNTADLVGGGLSVSMGTPVVRRCVFAGNLGGIDGGGGLTTYWAEPLVSECLFAGNSTPARGGGILNADSSPAVTNCTFVDNASASGGGMHTRGTSTALVSNCVFWDNTGPPGEEQLADALGGETFVSFSDVQGGYSGLGNIDADPAFADAGGGDYRLSPASPCIDAGDNGAVPADDATDLDGNPRRLDVPETPDTGLGALPVVDMGAYEALGGGCLALTSEEILCSADGTTFTVNFEGLTACTGGTTQLSFTGSGGAPGGQMCFTAIVDDGGFCCSTEICVTVPDCAPAPQASDLDGDGVVGIADFLALLAAWGPCPVCGDCPADFDGDCAVGIQDLLTLLAAWNDS